jgi:nicotinamidase-related amidase
VIARYGSETALLVIDVQRGVDDLAYYGGPTGRRNNLAAEDHMRELLDAWRAHGLPVFFSFHDSREAGSPLKVSLPTGASKDGLGPRAGEGVVTKDVNSAFIGTDLEIQLRRAGIRRLVNCGFFTNMCVETTTRQAGNLGFDTYLAHDACAATNRVGLDGVDREPELVHDMAVANLHGEFCTALTTEDLLSLLFGDRTDLDRVQGNE